MEVSATFFVMVQLVIQKGKNKNEKNLFVAKPATFTCYNISIKYGRRLDDDSE